jgi:CubicO group peptidase (beta-lactamase class C family)
MQMSLSRIIVACLFALTSAFSQRPQRPHPPAPPTAKGSVSQALVSRPQPPHVLEPADLTAFFDGILPVELDRGDISGAVVFVIQGDRVLLLKGYGWADAKKRTPVDPQTTMFRPGSISKLFTWISVMQLVQQGKLNLDRDVNDYLDFHIAPAFGRPVTLRNLMTHTPGFEEEVRDLILTYPERIAPLRAYLVANQPARIFPPGKVPAYSNYGAGLAGYIVQRVSGERYEDYVNRHIFTPLAMTHSTFEQPLPARLKDDMSHGYITAGGKRIPFEMVDPVPAGALATSGADMLRFARMLLHGGTLEGATILQPPTLAAMWTRQFPSSPDIEASGLGFYQFWRNGLQFWGHGGDLFAFHSDLLLNPAQNVALFVSYNSAGRPGQGSGIARSELFDHFVDRYWPNPSAIAGGADKSEQAKRAAAEIRGVWQSSRRAETDRLALTNLQGQAAVHLASDGSLVVETFHTRRGPLRHFTFAHKDLWQEVHGQDRLAEVRDPAGRVVALAFDFPDAVLQRVPWFERARLIVPAAAIALLLELIVCLSWLKSVIRRLRKKPLKPLSPVWLRIASLLWLLGAGVATLLLGVKFSGSVLPPSGSVVPLFIVQDVLVALAIAATVPALIAAARTALGSGSRARARIWHGLLAASCVFFVWFSLHWHLIGTNRY